MEYADQLFRNQVSSSQSVELSTMRIIWHWFFTLFLREIIVFNPASFFFFNTTLPSQMILESILLKFILCPDLVDTSTQPPEKPQVTEHIPASYF